MGGDFLNFLTIFVILIFMFTLIGNINFVLYCEEFSGLFASLATILDAALGNFGFDPFDPLTEDHPRLKNAGIIYIFAAVLIFTILILNLIIAILSNTYNLFQGKS